MPSKPLALDERYAMLYWTDRVHDCKSITLQHLPPGTRAWLYHGDDLAVCILLARQHSEPSLEWAQCAIASTGGQSALAAPLTAGEPPAADLWCEESIVRQDRDQVQHNGIFALYLASTATVLLFRAADSATGTPRSGMHLRFIDHASGEPLPEKVHSAKLYDPVLAQVSEILKRRPAALREAVSHAIKRWQTVFRTPAPAELQSLTPLLTALLDDAAETAKLIATGGVATQFGAMSVDNLSRWMDSCEALARKAIAVADEHAPDVYDGIWRANHARSLRHQTVRAADGFAAECARRGGRGRHWKIYTGYEARYEFLPLDMQFLDIGVEVPAFDPRSFLLLLPEHLQLRIGALPLVAHQIAHALIHDHAPDEQDLIFRWLRQNMERGDMSHALARAFAAFVHPEGSVLYATQLHPNLMAIDHGKGPFEIGHRWAHEVLCDLLAILLAGPAYVYALARFATGELAHFTTMTGFSADRPTLERRLEICLEYMAVLGYDSTFTSFFPATGRGQFPAPLAEELAALIPRAYTLEEHERVLTETKAALKRGVIARAPPTWILNALWDGVAKSDGYVHEIAAAMGLAGT